MKNLTLQDKQLLVRDAVNNMKPVHQQWRLYEGLYRTGMKRELTADDFALLTPTPIAGGVLKTINRLLPIISLMCTSVVARDPSFLVTARGGFSDLAEENAEIARAVLNYFWDRTNATQDSKDASEDMIKIGNGFTKTMWEYVATALEGASDQTEGLASNASLSYNLVEKDEPFTEYVSPYDIFVPRDTRRMETTRWVAQRLRLPVDELRDRFGEDVKIVADATTTSAELAASYEGSRPGSPTVLSYATVFEFYDMVNHEMSIFQLDGDEYLHNDDIPYAHRYPPFTHYRNYNDGGMQFWAFGDIENLAGIQLMIGETTRAELDDVKRSGNKYAIRKKYATGEIKKQLESPLPDQVLVFDISDDKSLSDVIVPMQRLATPPDVYNLDGKLTQAMLDVAAFNDFQAGGVGADRMAATTAAVVDGVATLRAQDKLAAVENGAAHQALLIILLCQEFLADDTAVRIAGPNGAAWIQVTKEDIQGEFSCKVEGGSTRALNPATRAQRGIQTIQTVIPTIQQLGYDPTNALRMALRDMGYDPNYLLQPIEQPLESQDPEALAPDMAQAQPQVDPMAGKAALDQLFSDPGMAPVDQVAQGFGGPGVPGASSGGLQL